LEVFMSTQNMAALLTLEAKLKARDKRAAERRRKQQEEIDRALDAAPAYRRMVQYLTGPAARYRHIAAHPAARLTRVPVSWLLRVTKGQPFRLDFGKGRSGAPLVLFRVVEFMTWAKRQTRHAGH
jgi:hypothetical protein